MGKGWLHVSNLIFWSNRGFSLGEVGELDYYYFFISKEQTFSHSIIITEVRFSHLQFERCEFFDIYFSDSVESIDILKFISCLYIQYRFIGVSHECGLNSRIWTTFCFFRM